MEEKKTIVDYLAQVFTIFGITILLVAILGQFFGEEAKNISDLFSLGAAGITLETMLQFLLVSAAVVLIRFLFFTDVLIKRMSIVGRTVGMLVSVVVIVAVMVFLCNWFPINKWESWGMFFLCFGSCFSVSVAVTLVKEKIENRKMEEALEKLKRAQSVGKSRSEEKNGL